MDLFKGDIYLLSGIWNLYNVVGYKLSKNLHLHMTDTYNDILAVTEHSTRTYLSRIPANR